jgi:hypothetical protein
MAAGAGSRAGWQAVQSRRSISIPITTALAELKFAPLLKVPPASRGEPCGARSRFPLPVGGTLRRGSVNRSCFCKLCIPSVGEWLYSGVMIYNNHRPSPNLPCTRGRNSLPACGEGSGGGDMLKPLRIGTDHPRRCTAPLAESACRDACHAVARRRRRCRARARRAGWSRCPLPREPCGIGAHALGFGTLEPVRCGHIVERDQVHQAGHTAQFAGEFAAHVRACRSPRAAAGIRR